jgi:hypothetical protein
VITFKQKGSFDRTEKFLKNSSRINVIPILERYAQEGVRALASNTPTDSGLTAGSWGYEIKVSRGSCSIIWTNSNIQDGVSIAIILQYGHGTGTGGYVQGQDYINPAMQPIFNKLSQELYQEVTRL